MVLTGALPPLDGGQQLRDQLTAHLDGCAVNVGDEVLLLMLQRVHDGAITERFGFYFDDGERIWYWAALVYGGLVGMGEIELIYPPDSGARRREFVPRGLVECSQLGLTEAEVTRRVALTAKGLARYKELCERQQASG